MDLDNSEADKFFRREEDKRGRKVCDGSRCKEIASLRAEINAMKKWLDIYCSHDNSEETQPRDHEATEAQTHYLNGTGDVNVACCATQAGPHPALLNDLIIRQLGLYLPEKDLRECRLVCKTWNAAVSVELQMRPLYLNLEKGMSIIDTERLNNLISSLESDRKFPYPGFLFPECLLYEHLHEEPEEEENSKIMKTFLSKWSHVFKRLRLPFAYVGFDAATQFVEYLIAYFSHMEVLDMGTLVRHKRMDPMDDEERRLLSSELEQLHLPQLKKLILPKIDGQDYGYQILVRHIITAAPKLQHIENFSTGLLYALEESGKMDLVSTMIFEDGDRLRYFEYTELASSPPCWLSHLEMSYMMHWKYDPDLSKTRLSAFLAILKANSNTLKSLTIRDLNSQLEDLPVLPKLKVLRIIGNGGKCSEAYRIFPSDVSNLFPSLTAVTVELTEKRYNDPPPAADQMAECLKFFLCDEPLLTVTSLRIHFPLEKHGIKLLGMIFPNVTKLSIDWESCFHNDGQGYRLEDLWNVWTLPLKLRRLEIHRLNLWSHEDFSLDSFLTGIPEPVCRNLRQQEFAQLSVDPHFYDALRLYPSMLNLKKSLRELVISVDYPPKASEYEMKKAYEQQTVSSLATSYGISLMKPISVYLAYDHRQFYSSSFKKFLAPIEGGNVVLLHKEFLRCPPKVFSKNG